MNQLKALFRETGWLWSICFIAAALMSYFLSLFFLVLLPMLLVVFVYFALMRFDSDGNPRDL